MEWISGLFEYTGYAQLFALSFLASTVLPVGSEWMLAAMVLNGASPLYCVLIASVGNYLGACTTYLIGRWGAVFVTRKVWRIDEAQMQRAMMRYEKYGSWSLLLSWVPVVGDPLCLAAGIFRVNPMWFSLLVFTGKFLRYAALAYLVS
ncbi:MAG: DedA family protein [Spartobacteria bacterium]|nr:DedA family protein [Spartobacteria bacterium]